MKTVFPFDKSPQHKNMIDSIPGVVQFATGKGNMPLNRAMCDGIVKTLEELVEMRPQHDALTRWETAFIIAEEYLAALDRKLTDLDAKAHLGDSLKNEILTKSKAVSRIVSYTIAEIEANLTHGTERQMQQGYETLRATYLPVLTQLQENIESTYREKGGQEEAFGKARAFGQKR